MKTPLLNTAIAIVVGSVFLATVMPQFQSKRTTNSGAPAVSSSPFDPLANRERANTALESFSIHGVNFSMSLEQFERQELPSAQYNRTSEPTTGRESFYTCFAVPGELLNFDFLDGKLYKMSVTYQAERVAKMGGAEAIRKNVIAAFGPPDEVYQDEHGSMLAWSKANRGAELSLRKEGGRGLVILSIEDPHLKSMCLDRWAANPHNSDRTREPIQRPKPQQENPNGYGLGMTMEGYRFLKDGMSKVEVDLILDCTGVEQSHADSITIYAWQKGLTNIVATFDDGKLVAKSQFGL